MKLFRDDVYFSGYITDPLVIKEANEIGSKGKLNGRTREQKQADALNGIALQYAVRQELALIGSGPGWDLLDPLDKTHDIRLKRRDGKEFLIDVKGRFSLGGRTITINEWEASNADPSTVYLVFDCENDIGKYRGYFTLWDAEEGQYGTFVWLSKLRQDNPFS
ncbi:MAG: hypothetical protein ACRDBH_08640 [Bosea sp. (in: a-proteobacteria)]